MGVPQVSFLWVYLMVCNPYVYLRVCNLLCVPQGVYLSQVYLRVCISLRCTSGCVPLLVYLRCVPQGVYHCWCTSRFTVWARVLTTWGIPFHCWAEFSTPWVIPVSLLGISSHPGLLFPFSLLVEEEIPCQNVRETRHREEVCTRVLPP